MLLKKSSEPPLIPFPATTALPFATPVVTGTDPARAVDAQMIGCMRPPPRRKGTRLSFGLEPPTKVASFFPHKRLFQVAKKCSLPLKPFWVCGPSSPIYARGGRSSGALTDALPWRHGLRGTKRVRSSASGCAKQTRLRRSVACDTRILYYTRALNMFLYYNTIMQYPITTITYIIHAYMLYVVCMCSAVQRVGLGAALRWPYLVVVLL
jgi:hypothetical protein